MSRPRTEGAAVYLAGTAAAFALLGDSALYAVLPTEGPSLGLSGTEVGILLSINRVVRLGLNEPAGAIVAKVGPRGPFVVALVLAAVTTFGCGRAGGAFVALLALRVAWSFAWSFIRHGANLAVLGSPAARRGQLLGSFRSISRTGSLVAVLAGSWLVEKLGLLRAYDLLALATLPGLAFAALTLKKEEVVKARVEEKPSAGEATLGSSAKVARMIAVTLAGALVHACGSSLLLSTASLAVRDAAAGATTVALLGTAIGVGTLGGIATSVRWTSEIALSPIAGRLVDTLSGRGVVALSGLATGACLFACALSKGPIQVACMAALSFAALACLLGALDALAAHEAGRAGARGPVWLGRYFSASDAGSAIGPFAGPALASAVGLPALHATGGVVSLVVALGALLVLSPEKREKIEARSSSS